MSAGSDAPHRESSTHGEETTPRDLVRQLGLLDVAAILVGNILGSGIFVAPAVVALAAGGAGAILLWVAGGLVAGCGALVYAECGTRLPRAGGFYTCYREAFGEAVAFVGGWAALLITYPASIAAIALIFGQYLGELVPALSELPWLSATAALLAVAVINMAGVRRAALTQRVLTAIKVVALTLVCLAALLMAGSSGPSSPEPTGAAAAHDDGSPVPAQPSGIALPPDAATGRAPDASPDRVPEAAAGERAAGGASGTQGAAGRGAAAAGGLAALLGAMVVVLWTYDGWSDISMMAGEVRDPGRTLSRSVVLGTCVLVVVYGAVQAAIGLLLPRAEAAASTRVLSDAVRSGLGPGSGHVVALLVVIATFGSVHGIILAASRLGFAMARDGVFFRWFGAIHPTLGTPARAIGVLAALSAVYVFVAEFRNLLAFFSFTVWIFYALTATGLLVLRFRRIGTVSGWSLPGAAPAPWILILAGAVMACGLFIESPARSATGLALLAVGFPVYLGWRRLAGPVRPAA